jgi:hypothetical protein
MRYYLIYIEVFENSNKNWWNGKNIHQWFSNNIILNQNFNSQNNIKWKTWQKTNHTFLKNSLPYIFYIYNFFNKWVPQYYSIRK